MEDVLQQIPGANQSQLGKHRMEKFFMLMMVTVCYRAKPINGMAVKKREMKSDLINPKFGSQKSALL